MNPRSFQRALVGAVTASVLLTGCGGGGTTSPGAAVSSAAAGAGSAVASAGSAAASAASSAAASATGGAASTASPAATSTAAATGDAACPTENTRSFAKTRFVADIGGSLFLFNRYLYQPYQRGDFQQGAQGRRTALVKAGLAAGAIVKLLDNAKENAKANPTLCRTVAEPLTQASTQLKGLAAGAATGNLAGIDAIRGLLGRVQSGAGSQVGNITEQNPRIPGLS